MSACMHQLCVCVCVCVYVCMCSVQCARSTSKQANLLEEKSEMYLHQTDFWKSLGVRFKCFPAVTRCSHGDHAIGSPPGIHEY